MPPVDLISDFARFIATRNVNVTSILGFSLRVSIIRCRSYSSSGLPPTALILSRTPPSPAIMPLGAIA